MSGEEWLEIFHGFQEYGSSEMLKWLHNSENQSEVSTSEVIGPKIALFNDWKLKMFHI